VQLLRRITIPYWSVKGHGWIPEDDFQGNALNDLKTSANTLSFFEYDGSAETLQRIAAAMICREGHIRNFGYALLNPAAISNIGVAIDRKGGETNDEFVDSLHVNVIEVSAVRLLELARLIFRSTRRELVKSEVKECVRRSKERCFLPEEAIPADVIDKL
jgi:hypothetical protein